jgi:hypothetical protein
MAGVGTGGVGAGGNALGLVRCRRRRPRWTSATLPQQFWSIKKKLAYNPNIYYLYVRSVLDWNLLVEGRAPACSLASRRCRPSEAPNSISPGAP